LKLLKEAVSDQPSAISKRQMLDLSAKLSLSLSRPLTADG
jgi:hypothetical protein